jgi:ubiquinone/menaquinone biosynthesis C-methylase UbiE
MDSPTKFQEIVRDERARQFLWERYAVSYDKILLEMPYYREVLDRHFQALSSGGVQRVLDVGCGTGNLALRLAGAARDVTAVDNSRAMLRKLSCKLTPATGQRVRRLEQNAESLWQFHDGCFDGVSILLALFDMKDAELALREAIRLLRRGGVLIVTEPKRSFQMKQILDACRAHLMAQGLYTALSEDLARVSQENWRLDPQTRQTHSPLRAEVIEDILRDGRFVELEIQDSHFGNCATIKGRRP